MGRLVTLFSSSRVLEYNVTAAAAFHWPSHCVSKCSGEAVCDGQTQNIYNRVVELFCGMSSLSSYWHSGDLVLRSTFEVCTTGYKECSLNWGQNSGSHTCFVNVLCWLPLWQICIDNLSNQCLTLKIVYFFKNKKCALFNTGIWGAKPVQLSQELGGAMQHSRQFRTQAENCVKYRHLHKNPHFSPTSIKQIKHSLFNFFW